MRKIYYLPLFVFAALLLGTSFVTSQAAYGQCIQIIDNQTGTATLTPSVDYDCSKTAPGPGAFPVNLANPVAAGDSVFIDWGDGARDTLLGGASAITHIYTGDNIFTYTITQTTGGCGTTITGLYENRINNTLPGVGFSTPSSGSASKRCVPATIAIQNFSSDMNGYTLWEIDWGDGNTDVVDVTSFGDSIFHTYLPNTTGCGIFIDVTYLNRCPGGVQGGGGVTPSASYGEYLFRDIDSAIIGTGDVIICSPTDVTFDDASILNCLDSTNRTIQWESGAGFATAFNSGPLPYENGANRSFTVPAAAFTPIPADSLYTIQMTISGACGSETTTAQVRLVAPEPPIIELVQDSLCPNQGMTWNNRTRDPYNVQDYFWEFGDGRTSNATGTGSRTRSYPIGGTYTVKLTTIINAYNGQRCELTDSIDVFIKETVTPRLSADTILGCDSLRVTARNTSLNAIGSTTWFPWKIIRGWGSDITTAGTGDFIPTGPTSAPAIVSLDSTSPADSSAVFSFKQHGRYNIVLNAQSSSCPLNGDTVQIDVYPTPTIRFRVSDTSLCLGENLTIYDSSRVITTERRNLNNNWRNLKWRIEWGDGTDTAYPISSFISGSNTDFDNPTLGDRINNHIYPDTGTYTLKLFVFTPYSCEAVDSIQIVVNPVAEPDFSLIPDTCSPALVLLSDSTQGPVNRYEIDIDRKLNGINVFVDHDDFAIDSSAFPDTLLNLPYVFPGDSTFYRVLMTTYTYSPGDTCIASHVDTVMVPPSPQPGFVKSASSGCTPVTNVNFTNVTANLPAPAASFNYYWDFGNGNLDTTFTVTDPVPAQNYVNTTSVRQTYFITLTVSSSVNPCVFTFLDSVVVLPDPNIAITSPDTICADVVTLTATGAGISLWNWDLSSFGLANSSAQNPTVDLSTFSGTFPVTLTAQNAAGCSKTVSKNITILPPPLAIIEVPSNKAFDPDTVICNASFNPITFRADVATGREATFTWDFGDGTVLTDVTDSIVTHTFPNNTSTAPISYTVRLTTKSSFGCESGAAERVITVNPTITASFISNLYSGCSPVSPELFNFSIPNSFTYNYNYSVSLIGDASVVNLGGPNRVNNGYRFNVPLQNLSDTIQQYEVFLRVEDGSVCVDEFVDTITVSPLPNAGFDVVDTSNSQFCAPVTMRFDPSARSRGINPTYIWNWGDGTSDTTTQDTIIGHTFDNPNAFDQLYTIRLRVVSDSGCIDDTLTQIIVKPNVTSSFTIDTNVGCSPFAVNFTNTSSNGTGFQWLVNGTPIAISSNLTRTFTDTSATDTSFYRVRLVAFGSAGACADTSAETVIKVLPQPKPEFQLSAERGCSPFTPAILGIGDTGVTTWNWYTRHQDSTTWDTIGSFTNNNSFSLTFNNPSTGTVEYTIRLVTIGPAGCKDSLSRTVRVFPFLDPQITFNTDPDTANCSPYNVRITNASGLGATFFEWYVEGALTAAPAGGFDTTFSNGNPYLPEEKVIQLDAIFVEGGVEVCRQSTTRSLVVHPNPSIGLDVDTLDFCSPAQFRFTLENANGLDSIDWYVEGQDTLFGTTDSLASLLYTYIDSGTVARDFSVKAVGRNVEGCIDSVVRTIRVFPAVGAEFEVDTNQGCSPFLASGSITTKTPGTNRGFWEFIQNGVVIDTIANINPFSYTFTNPSPTEEDTVTINLITWTATNSSCRDTSSRQVFLKPQPSIGMILASPDTVCGPATITLSATVVGADSITWFFGDGDTLGQRFADTSTRTVSASHLYTNTLSAVLSQEFLPIVEAFNPDGCRQTNTRSVFIKPTVTASIAADTLSGCSGSSLLFTSTSTNANRFTWRVDGVTESVGLASFSRTFVNLGDTIRLDTVELVVGNSLFDCFDTTFVVVEVFPEPQDQMQVIVDEECGPPSIRFVNTTSPIRGDSLTFTWRHREQGQTAWIVDTVTGSTNTLVYSDPFIDSTQAINYEVQLITSSTKACTVDTSTFITIYPVIDAEFDFDTNRSCSPFAARGAITTKTPATNRGYWLFEQNGQLVDSIPSIDPFNYTFINPSATSEDTVRVYLVSWNSANSACRDTFVRELYIDPQPAIGPISALPDTICGPAQISLSVEVLGADTITWFFGDGTSLGERFPDTTRRTVSASHVFTNINSNVLPQEFSPSIEAFNTIGCGNIRDTSVFVEPSIVASISTDTLSGCSGNIFSFTSSSTNANTFLWKVDGAVEPISAGVFSKQFLNFSDTIRLDTIELVVGNSNFPCFDTAAVVIEVFPEPKDEMEVIVDQSCSPPLVRLINRSRPIRGDSTIYTWRYRSQGGAWIVDTVMDTIGTIMRSEQFSDSSQSAINYEIELITSSSQGCSVDTSTLITIFPYFEPRISLNVADSGCQPYQIRFSDATNNAFADVTEWYFDTTTARESSLSSFTVNFLNADSGTTNDSIVRIFLRKGNAANGCFKWIDTTVVIHPSPIASFDILNRPLCSEKELIFLNTSQPDSTEVAYYVWNFDNDRIDTTTSDSSMRYTFTNLRQSQDNGFVELTVVTKNGCSDLYRWDTLIPPTVQAEFDISDTAGCSPLNVQVTDRTQLAENSYEWTINGSVISSNASPVLPAFVNNSYDTTRVDTITMTVWNSAAPNCRSSLSRIVKTYPSVDFNPIVVEPLDTGCADYSVLLWTSSSNAERYIWRFGDGVELDTTADSVRYTYTNASPQSLSRTVEVVFVNDSGCRDSVNATIIIAPKITAGIRATVDSGCSPLSVQFLNVSSANANTFEWDFGDGTTSASELPTHTFINQGTSDTVFTVRLISSVAGEQCADTAFYDIEVFPVPEPAISVNGIIVTEDSAGCAPFNLIFENATAFGDSAVWYFSSAFGRDTIVDLGQAIDTIFTNETSVPQTFRVTLNVFTDNGCTAIDFVEYNIDPLVEAKIVRTILDDCTPQRIRFENDTFTPFGLQYEWDFDDGSVPSFDNMPVHVFENNTGSPIAREVVLTARLGNCVATDTIEVITYPAIQAAFEIDDPANKLLKLPDSIITLRNLTNNQESFVNEWSVTIGSNRTTFVSQEEIINFNVVDFINNFDATRARITLKVIDTNNPAGCADSVVDFVDIDPITPEANFEILNPIGCEPLTVTLISTSSFANFVVWNYGDGNRDTVFRDTVLYTYRNPGQYDIRLRAVGPEKTDGTRDTDDTIVNEAITVYPRPSASFFLIPSPPRTVQIPEEAVRFTPAELDTNWSYFWDFGDGNTSEEMEPEHFYSDTGRFDVILTVTSENGCVDRDTSFSGVRGEFGGTVVVPNIFTPIQGGSESAGRIDPLDINNNEIFYPYTEGVEEILIRVYNRWGELIFESTEINVGWTGYYLNQLVKQDTYVYYIEGRLPGGKKITRVGDVTVAY